MGLRRGVFPRRSLTRGLGLLVAALLAYLSLLPAAVANSRRYDQLYNDLAAQIEQARQQQQRIAEARVSLEERAEKLKAKIDDWAAYAYKTAAGARHVPLPLVPNRGIRNQGARAYLATILENRKELVVEYRDLRDRLAELEVAQQTAQEWMARRQAQVGRIRDVLRAEEVRAAAQPPRSEANAGAFPEGTVYPNEAAEIAVNFARAQLGEMYLFAAAGPDRWDCSGLTMKAWAAAGYTTLSHYSGAQFNQTTRITRDELLPGDLVFLPPDTGSQHVALYIGSGLVISAPSAGNPVRIQPLYDDAGFGRVW